MEHEAVRALLRVVMKIAVEFDIDPHVLAAVVRHAPHDVRRPRPHIADYSVILEAAPGVVLCAANFVQGTLHPPGIGCL